MTGTLPPINDEATQYPLPGGGSLQFLRATPEGTGSTAPAPQPDSAAGPADGEAPLRTLAGPRGTVAAVPENVQQAGAPDSLLRRLGRVAPDRLPRPRAQDYVEEVGNRIAIRPATEIEAQEIADILASPGAATRMQMISTRGDYMPTDVQEFIGAVRGANQTLFDELRRGVQSREQQIAMAERLGLDGIVDRLLTRRAGEAFNNEELISGAVALVNIKRETDEAAAALLLDPSPAAQRRFGLNVALTAAISGQLNGATAEAGRALGALRFAGDALRSAPPEQVGMMAQRLGVLGQAGPQGLRVPNTDEAIVDALGGADVLNALATTWHVLPNASDRVRMAQRSLGRRTVDAITELYINSLLALPTTHLKNLIGNTGMTLMQLPERFLAGAIGGTRRAVRLGSDERVYMLEAHAQMMGMFNGLNDGLRAAWGVMRTGIPANMVSKLDLRNYRSISAENFQLSGTMGRAMDLLGTVVTIPGRTLMSADAFFQTVGQRGELWAQARREYSHLREIGVSDADAADQVVDMLAHPPERWRDAADASARAMTFQQDMGPHLAGLANVMQHPLAKAWVPFFTTPTNIYRAVLQRSPLGIAMSPQVWADISAGGARADMAMSRIALGSTLMYWAYGQVQQAMTDPDFRITGSEPSVPDNPGATAALRATWRRQGFQPNSVCYRENGRWTCQSYAGLDPISGLLAMAADAAQYVNDNPQLDPDDLGEALQMQAAGAAYGLYEYVLQQPFASGVSDLARALGNPQMSPHERYLGFVGTLVGKVANEVLEPMHGGSLGAGIERMIDPTTRSTMPQEPGAANSGPITRGFYQALRRSAGRTPWNAGEGEPTLNLWGEEVRPTEGGAWELFWPIRTTSGRADRLEEVLYRLGGVFQPPRRTFPGTSVHLTAGQYNRLIREMNAPVGGMTMRDEMSILANDPGFTVQDPAEQIKALRHVYAQRWQAATRSVLEQDFDLGRRVQRDRDHRAEFGRSPADGDAPQMR